MVFLDYTVASEIYFYLRSSEFVSKTTSYFTGYITLGIGSLNPVWSGPVIEYFDQFSQTGQGVSKLAALVLQPTKG